MKGRAFIPVVIFAALVGCSKGSSDTPNAGQATGSDIKPTTAATFKSLKTEDTVPGTGEGAKSGDTLTMLYHGSLVDGTVFDSNMSADGKPDTSKPPFALVLGMGQVIKGWDEGLKGIKTGCVRKIMIPSEMGYGAQGSGEKIPPNSDLVFTVKCLDIVHQGEEKVIDIKDLKVGSGAEVKNGDKVTIHYVGTLLNGKQFDSSREKNQPFEFTVGAGEVVAGFDKGLLGMRRGGLRKLRIPPMAAYGSNPNGGIPPNSVLNFEIECLKINGK